MPKYTSTHEMNLHEPPVGMSLSHWLYQELRSAILTGRLPPESRLPSTRELARQYQVARGTVVTAFEQLRVEGYIQSTVGSGTIVAKLLPEELLQVPTEQEKGITTSPSTTILSKRG